MNGMTKERITISIDPALLERIDRERGLVPRSTYIESILAEALGMRRKGAIVPR